MIYYQDGLMKSSLHTIDKNDSSDFNTLVKLLRDEPDGTEVVPINMINYAKRHNVKYTITGEMKTLIRNNENMISRSLLILDMDDIACDENTFIASILQRMNNVRFIAYPSINHNVKGTRYRLIFDINRPITTAEEFSGLVELVTRDIYENILNQSDYKADISNKTFSQVQGWHIKTEANKDSPILINEDGKPLDIDKLLKKIPQPSQHDFTADYSHSNYGIYKKPREWTIVMRTLISGEIHEGERHQFYLMAFRAILFGCVYDDELLGYYIDLIEKFNASRCYPPYPVKDLEKEFKEALRYVLDRI